MLNKTDAPFSLAHISLLFIGLMWVLPFLNYYHAYPITTFYQEWGAVLLGLCATPLLVTRRYWQQPEIPRILLLPLGLILLVLTQFALGKIPYFDQTLLFTLYLLWAALLIMLGQRLRAELGLPVLVAALAVFLLLGAELNALAGIIQHYRWHTFLDGIITVKIADAVYGNTGQPNHFADYITLGLISLGLLHTHWRMRVWQVTLLAAPLLFVLVLSGSRSAWAYLLFLAAMTFLWQRRDPASRPLLKFSLLLVLGFGLMHFIVQLPWLAGTSGSVTSVERLVTQGAASFSQGGESSIRLRIWHEAWLIFAQFPLLGAGMGQFAWQHFLLGPSQQNIDITGLYNNAHNLVMQTAAEMGLAGLALLFGTLALWFWHVRKAPRTLYHWWGYALLAVLGIHSLLEYPLWYAYFLGVAALLLGMLDNASYRLELRGVGRLSALAIILFGVLSLTQLWNGYRNLEILTNQSSGSAGDDEYAQRMAAVRWQSLLRPYAELLMSGMIDVSDENLAEKRTLNESTMRFVPVGPLVYRQALLLAQSGEEAAAQAQMERAIWSYPGNFQHAHEQLDRLARKDPAHFAALLKFASQKYEERQLAVHTR